MKFCFSMPHMLRLKATVQPWEQQVNGSDQQRMAQAEIQGYDVFAVPEHFIIRAEYLDYTQ